MFSTVIHSQYLEAKFSFLLATVQWGIGSNQQLGARVLSGTLTEKKAKM